MELIRSNRTETLADALASKVREEPLPPFETETIVVQSTGIAHWLSLQLAKRLSIWANPAFPFPRTAIEQVLAALDEEADDKAKAYDRDCLRWTIAQMLDESPPAELEGYLGSPVDTDRALRLALSVAGSFDDYTVYRPHLLAAWQKGTSDHWQAVLWRRVAEALGAYDLSSRMDRASARLGSDQAVTRVPFRRLHLFSLETLPPSFIRFFGQLSRRIPTTLYVLEPCSEYRGDAGTRAAAQLMLQLGNGAADGHPLLAGAGQLSGDFQRLLLDASEAVPFELELEAFVAPGRSTLLSAVQSDILELAAPPPASERPIVSGEDDSIALHQCPDPLREVQVLSDQIRGALEDDSTLRPEDIVVMAPDLETYAPLFRAVFGQECERPIPFDVHDRRSREDAPFYEDFLMVLELLDSRFSVLDLVRLMDAKSLRTEFRFSSDERARLADLTAAAGVRWGIDGGHREEEGFPREDLHTWREGLERLFLGFASEPDASSVFSGVLPRGAPTLDDISLVARLSGLLEVLFSFHGRTRGRLSLERWAEQLDELCERLLSDDDESGRALYLLRGSISDLRNTVATTGFQASLSLAAVRRELVRLLSDRTPAVGFLRHGVTLTELVPLRSVPFRIVCLLGMSEDAFPRPDERPSFDLRRSDVQYGDRNRRTDDRHSFLQALLCARDRLLITFSGAGGHRAQRSNPSPMLWELCETVNRYYRSESDEDPVLAWTSHPLHAFDAGYFTGESLPRSFSGRDLELAKALRREPSERPRIELIAPVAAQPETVSALELTHWLWNPIRAFLDGVVRAGFEESSLYEPSGALIEIGRLEQARVGNSALRADLRGARLEEYLGATPEFPDGTPGRIERRRLGREIEAVAARASELRSGTKLRDTLLSVQVEEQIVEARLQGLDERARVLHRFTRVHRKAELATWVEHLLLNTADDPDLPRETRLVLRGTEKLPSVVSYKEVSSAREHLAQLLELYRQSLREPVPLMERASLEYVASLDGGLKKALSAASKAYDAQRKWDARLRYLFGENDPFEDPVWSNAFAEVAEAVYRPLLDHRSES
jgi:exodeoxyribonuclease V gamma subunit